jgi:hypothetical protein
MVRANFRSGVTYAIWFKQDATGSRTVSWGTGFDLEWAGSSTPTITATAGAADKVDIMWDGANNQYLASIAQNYV